VCVCLSVKIACCDEGFKLLMDVIFCEAPCCPGLREIITDEAPHLGMVVACEGVRITSLRVGRVGMQERNSINQSIGIF